MRVHTVKPMDWHLGTLLLLLAGIAAARLHSFLLFHVLAELAWLGVALTAFAIAWNTRRNLDNPILLAIGISLGPLAVMRIMHTLAFKGMGVFATPGANLATQLWVAERGLEAAAALVAVAAAPRRLSPNAVLAVTSAVGAALMAAIFMGAFPVCYLDGVGLTPFKIVAEHGVMAAFAVTVVRLYTLRALFPPRLFRLLQAALVLAVLEEACFTLYIDVHGALNALGHLLQVAYAVLIYLGVVRFGLSEPQDALYHQLQSLNGRLAEEAVRNNERAALAVEAVGGATWEWDMRSPHAVAAGGTWREAVEPADLARFDAVVAPRGPDTGRTAEYRVRRGDGGSAWYVTTTRVYPSPAGARMIGLDLDVTAHKQVEAERAALSEDIRRFAEVLAHHLQEPARLQSCYAQVLRRHLPGPLAPDVAEALDVVQGGAEHLRRLLRDAHLYLVLDRLPPPEHPVACNGALARAWEALRDEAAACGAALDAGELPSVFVVDSRLEDLFAILLSNALEYRHRDRAPMVTVRARDQLGEVVIEVADNGIGIDPVYFERVFVPFERLHTAAEYAGTGIGLALARRIVETAGGRIWLSSVPGAGTTVHVALPKRGTP